MTSSIEATDPAPAEVPVQAPVERRYDLKLEVGVKSGNDTVPIVAIFHDLVKHMRNAVKEGEVTILTATDRVYSENGTTSQEDFQKSFKVDHIGGKAPKVLLGFKLITKTTLYDIKQRLMKSYLIPHDLFLREHVGGFQNGVKTFMYGFLKQDHPDHPDQASLKARFAKLTSATWKNLDKTDRMKWKNETPEIFYADGIAIPVNFSKERVVAEVESQIKIITYALGVSTPKKYGPLLRLLLDTAILGKKITNLIPFAFQQENPTGFYKLIAEQERFMEQHRNIPISNIPYDVQNQKGKQGKTLNQALSENKDILRVAYDHKIGQYHVSTLAPKYRDVHNWIQSVLTDNCFPFRPTLRSMKYGSVKGGTQVKYSTVFEDAISLANVSYEASTIKTTRSNAWKQRPPLNISYVPTADAFPPLPQKPSLTPATASTMSETLDEETIRSAISSALKTVQEQHRQEIDKLKKEMTEKMAEMEGQMHELGKQVATQTFQALVKEDSPLVTKTDHAHLQREMNVITVQLSKVIQMLSATPESQQPGSHTQPGNMSPPRTNKRLKQNRTPEKLLGFDQPSTNQDAQGSSAAFESDEDLEGCEN